MKQHTLFSAPLTWRISGSTIDVAGNPNIAIGAAVVEHTGGTWVVEQQLNELRNRYDIVPLEEGAAATSYRGINGALGPLGGSLAFFDDIILSVYVTDDGHSTACESFRLLESGDYETRGALFRDGGHVSSWSYVLQKA